MRNISKSYKNSGSYQIEQFQKNNNSSVVKNSSIAVKNQANSTVKNHNSSISSRQLRVNPMIGVVDSGRVSVN